MSLRHVGRTVAQGSMRAVQGIKEQASKSIKDTASASSSSKQVRRFASSLDSSTLKSGAVAGEDKRRKAEESLRTVMYLSCWGPN